MLPKERRIPRNAFAQLKEGGKTAANDLFLLRFAPLPQNESRFSFTVSKKTSKNAVVRNRMRRVGYSVLEKNLPNVKPNTIASIHFKRTPRDDAEIAKSLISILKKSNLIK